MYIDQAVDESESILLHDACVSASLLDITNTPLMKSLLQTIGNKTEEMLHSVFNSCMFDEDVTLHYRTTPIKFRACSTHPIMLKQTRLKTRRLTTCWTRT